MARLIKKIIFKRNGSSVKSGSIKMERLNKLTRRWTYTPQLPSIKILGRSVKKPAQSAMSYVSDIYGLSKGHAIPFCINLGYRPFIRSNLVKPAHWLRIKRLVEKNEMLEKRLKRFELLTLRTNVKQGNFQSKKFWRGLPMHGQNARTNGNTARRLNINRLPPNMRLKSTSPFLMVSKAASRVLTKKLLPKKQGISEKGQFAKRYKKKKPI
jgi:ribosomal protein S13